MCVCVLYLSDCLNGKDYTLAESTIEDITALIYSSLSDPRLFEPALVAFKSALTLQQFSQPPTDSMIEDIINGAVELNCFDSCLNTLIALLTKFPFINIHEEFPFEILDESVKTKRFEKHQAWRLLTVIIESKKIIIPKRIVKKLMMKSSEFGKYKEKRTLLFLLISLFDHPNLQYCKHLYITIKEEITDFIEKVYGYMDAPCTYLCSVLINKLGAENEKIQQMLQEAQEISSDEQPSEEFEAEEESHEEANDEIMEEEDFEEEESYFSYDSYPEYDSSDFNPENIFITEVTYEEMDDSHYEEYHMIHIEYK